MNIKSFFKLRFVLFSIVAITVTGFLGRAFSLNNPVFWFTLVPHSPPGPGIACLSVITDIPFGWPLFFWRTFGTNGCEVDFLLNPISLLLDFGVFLVIGEVIFKRRKKSFVPFDNGQTNA